MQRVGHGSAIGAPLPRVSQRDAAPVAVEFESPHLPEAGLTAWPIASDSTAEKGVGPAVTEFVGAHNGWQAALQNHMSWRQLLRRDTQRLFSQQY